MYFRLVCDFSIVHILSVLFLFFTGKAKQLEAKMVQKLQEDVDMGDEVN